MANQMVALQARAPQNSILGPSIQRGAQMANMMMQQRASERQAAQAQQTLDIQAAQEARAAQTQTAAMRKAEVEYAAAVLAQFREAIIDLPENDLSAAQALRADLVEKLPAYDNFIAPATSWNTNTRAQIAAAAEQQINKLVATPVVSLGFTEPTAEDPNSYPVQIQLGGFTPGVTRIGERVTSTTPRGTPATPQPSQGGRMEGPPMVEPTFRGENPPLSEFQKDHLKRLEAELGITSTPASFTRGGMGATNAVQMTPEMAQTIYDSAISTGVMAQTDFDQLLAMAPPQNRQAFVNMLQQKNITLEPNAPSLAVSGARTPQLEFAVMRGPAPQSRTANLGGEPVQQTLAQSGEYRPIVLKRPTPPGANVAPGVLGSQKAAETAGSENVKVVTQPQIEAGVERVKRLEKLRGELPRALSETQVLVNNLTDRIKAIDDFLRSPYRNSIIGMVEGRIPRVLQTPRRADAQADYDYITSNTVLQKLIDDRAQTETGASPQGVVSDRDLQVAVQAATKLTQTGTERKQEVEMQRLRDVLYRTRELALKRYGDVYREVVKEAPELRLDVRPVAPKYTKVPSGTGATTKAKPKATPPRRVTPTGGWGKATVVGG
jgi:hypothetical protein